MRVLRFFLWLPAAALAGCGNVEPLRAPPGQPLPVKPLLAREVPTPAELLTPPVYANPERVDELVRRSEPRRPDRFDLPPPDGGIAPVVETDEEPIDAGPIPPVDPGL